MVIPCLQRTRGNVAFGRVTCRTNSVLGVISLGWSWHVHAWSSVCSVTCSRPWQVSVTVAIPVRESDRTTVARHVKRLFMMVAMPVRNPPRRIPHTDPCAGVIRDLEHLLVPPVLRPTPHRTSAHHNCVRTHSRPCTEAPALNRSRPTCRAFSHPHDRLFRL